jgi:hypothetical protein
VTCSFDTAAQVREFVREIRWFSPRLTSTTSKEKVMKKSLGLVLAAVALVALLAGCAGSKPHPCAYAAPHQSNC